MVYEKLFNKCTDGFVQEVRPLVSNQDFGTTKACENMLKQEVCNNFYTTIFHWHGLFPLGQIFYCSDNVPHTSFFALEDL